MIGKIEGTDQPGQDVYVPLRWNDELGRWQVPGKPAERVPRFLRSMDAAVVCWVRFRARYRELVHAARVLRVMCEHPDFAFESDAVSSNMVREQAQALSLEQEEVERLLDEPRGDDVVYLHDTRYVLDPGSERLDPHDDDIAPAIPMPPPGPRARFDWLVYICRLFAEELTGQEPAPLQVEALVSRVQERLRAQGTGRRTEH